MEKILYLSKADVESCGLTVGDIIEALEEAFTIKGQGGLELPPKPGIHPREDSFLHAMPAYLKKPEAAGIKWVSAFPGNLAKGLPYIAALVIMNDPDTGLPTAVMDGTWMTAWRTAGVSAVSAKKLARPGAEVLAVCGAGVQGRTNLDALVHALPGLKEARIYDISAEGLKAYLAEKEPQHPDLNLIAAGSTEEAVRGADIVVTAGPMPRNPTPSLEGEWLAEGCLGLPIDFDAYFRPSAFAAGEKFYTDDLDQIRYYQSLGYFGHLPEEIIDLGQLYAGDDPGRESDSQRIIACNLGIAMDDVVVGALLIEKAKGKGLGTWLDM